MCGGGAANWKDKPPHVSVPPVAAKFRCRPMPGCDGGTRGRRREPPPHPAGRVRRGVGLERGWTRPAVGMRRLEATMALIDVVKWDAAGDELVWKFPNSELSTMTRGSPCDRGGSTIVLRGGQ
jgi:hypothetical protein